MIAFAAYLTLAVAFLWPLSMQPTNGFAYTGDSLATVYFVAENGRRGRLDPEYELLDTGAFEHDRYWIVEVDYAKADPADVLMRIRVSNRGPEAAPLTVLPSV